LHRALSRRIARPGALHFPRVARLAAIRARKCVSGGDQLTRMSWSKSVMRKSFAYALQTLLCAGLFVAVPAVTASAQDVGVRAGVSVDPDQFYFGGHFETAPLVDRLHFRPNVEIGVGDDTTLIGFNIEFAYKFPSRNPWHLYAGAGPALNIVDRNDNTETEGGFNILVGVEHTKGLFVEFKVGTIDSPDFKIGVGYTWR
jgi:hypothetical protein